MKFRIAIPDSKVTRYAGFAYERNGEVFVFGAMWRRPRRAKVDGLGALGFEHCPENATGWGATVESTALSPPELAVELAATATMPVEEPPRSIFSWGGVPAVILSLRPRVAAEEIGSLLQHCWVRPVARDFPNTKFFFALVIWQLVAALCALTVIYLFHGGTLPWSALAYGVTLSLTGTLICGAALTFVGAAVAGFLFTFSFAVGFGAVSDVVSGGSLATEVWAQEPISRMLLGVASVSMPPLYVWFLTIVTLAVAGYTMANADRLGSESVGRGRLVLGAVGGFCAGILVPITLGVGALFAYIATGSAEPTWSSLSVAYAIVGSGTFAVVVGTRSTLSGLRQVLLIWVLHGGFWLLVAQFAYPLFAESWAFPFLLGVIPAYFHGSIFVCAYIVGAKIGGPRAGAMACALEGALGYLGFLAFTYWSKPVLQMFVVVSVFLTALIVMAAIAYFIVSRRQSLNFFAQFLPASAVGFGIFLVIAAWWQSAPGLVEFLAVWMHRVGLITLGLFLAVAQYLQLEGMIRISMKQPSSSLAACYGRLHVITELVPGVSALLILFSGLVLTHAKVTGFPGWLVLLTGLFAFMFVDGLTHFRGHVKKMHEATKAGAVRFSQITSVGNAVSLFVHFASYPVAVYLGVVRPDLSTVLSGWLGALAGAMSAIGVGSSASSLVALAIWMGVCGGSVLFFRLMLSRFYSRVWRKTLSLDRASTHGGVGSAR
ncbi:MAG: hypothetical protein AAF384_19400 [Pseudomonadota bacterium]